MTTGIECEVLHGDCRLRLPEIEAGSVQCCVVSPPYWLLRDYGHPDQTGHESTPAAFVATLVAVFREVRRVLRDDGTLWLNIGDTYAAGGRGGGGCFAAERKGRKHLRERTGFRNAVDGLKPKDLVGIPWRTALALQDDGWYLRCDIVWQKSNPMPSSVRDRPTHVHEYIFLLSKCERYYYDCDAIRTSHVTPNERRSTKTGKRPMRGAEALRPRGNLEASEDGARRYFHPLGRNSWSVWSFAVEPSDGEHFAETPIELARRAILAGSRPGDLVLDPFSGRGNIGIAARRNQRRFLGIELNAQHAAASVGRIIADAPLLEIAR